MLGHTKSQKIGNIAVPISLVFAYLVFVYFAMSFLFSNGLAVSIKDSSDYNLPVKILCDFITSLLIVAIILVINHFVEGKPLSQVGLSFSMPLITIGLLLIFVSLFIIHGDFTARGFYAAYFYLFVVAFSEELVFRGYLFTALHAEMRWGEAAIISGILWGIPHAFGPILKGNGNAIEFMFEIFSQFGFGIVVGTVFVFLYTKSKTLYIPVLVHAILDYMGMFSVSG